ncbi:MAG TPA: N-6 DNA methylase [Xenococcaceae cyanobacterium]
MDDYLFSDRPEKNFLKTSNQNTRKKYAQFFTPFDVASFMASWVIASRENITILDPSVGLGIFFRAAYKLQSNLKFIGYDIEQKILSQTIQLLNNSQLKANIKLLCQDYLVTNWEKKYDGIICNPPYLKFHDFPNKNKALLDFYDFTKIKLSGFSNIYTLFLIKSILHSLFKDKADIFFAYLLTEIAQEIFNEQRREYGNGLKKFEPNDINKSKIIDFNLIDNFIIDEIKATYQLYKNQLLKGKENIDLINQINTIFLSLLS